MKIAVNCYGIINHISHYSELIKSEFIEGETDDIIFKKLYKMNDNLGEIYWRCKFYEDSEKFLQYKLFNNLK